MNSVGAAVSDDVSAIVAKLLKIPDSSRSFRVSEPAADAEFRIGRDLQAALRVVGLPCRRTGEGVHFDGTDLLNVALHLDIGSRQRRVLDWWARELCRPYGDLHSYQVDYVASCPGPHRCKDCEFSLLRPSRSRLRVQRSLTEPTVVHTELFMLARVWPQFPAKLLELIDDFSWIKYLRLPDPLCWDTEFILKRGVGDCSGFGRILAAEGRARGLESRFCYGRSLTPPFSAAHYWAEFRIDGVWVPVDPLLIDALVEWRILDPALWGRNSSLGAIMGRLANRFRPLALHNGGPAPIRLRVYHSDS
ncbi:transglutaminase domain-containing protein [Kitasatospora sp. NPDC056138]|uniref:transglutaminase domain-containing protein n=1 Tax=Kitasatospora sp. NPDC056138 TaxID=3345724 RepID=UPI0035DDA6C3